MEVPVLSRLSGFEAEITLLQNPSFISRFFHLSVIEETIKVQNFWTWGALILALLATFSSVISRFKLVIIRLCKGRSVISQPLLQQLYEDDDDSSSEYEDESCSSSSSAVSSDDEEDDSTCDEKYDEDFRVAGQGQNRKFKYLNGEFSFSWSDFVNGKGVVKSWDGLGLGLGLEKASESLISLWDLNKPEMSVSFPGGKYQIPALTMPSPSVIMSAGLETSRNALRVFDTRVGRQMPQILAEWQPSRKKYSGIDSNDPSDDVSGGSVVVRDIRKIASPMENLTESDFETWWDSDAVIVDGNREIYCLGNDCRSVVSRCRNAVLSYLL